MSLFWICDIIFLEIIFEKENIERIPSEILYENAFDLVNQYLSKDLLNILVKSNTLNKFLNIFYVIHAFIF